MISAVYHTGTAQEEAAQEEAARILPAGMEPQPQIPIRGITGAAGMAVADNKGNFKGQ